LMSPPHPTHSTLIPALPTSGLHFSYRWAA